MYKQRLSKTQLQMSVARYQFSTNVALTVFIVGNLMVDEVFKSIIYFSQNLSSLHKLFAYNFNEILT